MNYHTILGSGGVVANELAKLLIEEKQSVKLVSRSGHTIQGAIAAKADVASLHQAVEAVRDSSIVYLCVGLKYDRKVWGQFWPRIMSNVIDACKRTGAKLVFFDNVYMYGKVSGVMTESTPYNPCSKKGEIRAAIATALINEVKAGNLRALIARAADFYGPHADKTGVPNVLVFSPLAHGKKANWLVNDQVRHSYTFTLDIAKALRALSMSDEAYNQVWHLPTAPNPLTGKEFVKTVAKEFGVDPDYRVLSKWLLKIGGTFDKTVAESYEMLYQSEFEYLFDSSKFQNLFHLMPTSYQDGIKETANFYKVLKD